MSPQGTSGAYPKHSGASRKPEVAKGFGFTLGLDRNGIMALSLCYVVHQEALQLGPSALRHCSFPFVINVNKNLALEPPETN